MRNSKKWVSILAAAAVAASTVVPAAAEVRAEEKKDGFVIGFSDMILGSNVFFQEMEAEAEEHLQKYKDEGIISEYYMTNADGDLMKQQSDIRDLITKGCDAILVCPISADGLTGVLQEARDAGIEIGLYGQNCNFDDKLFCVATDDKQLGYETGKFIAAQIPEGGKVFEIAGIAGAETVETRREWAEKGFYEVNPTAEIVACEYCDWDYAKSKVAMESLFTTYPDVDAVLTYCGANALAALDLMEEKGMDPLPVGGDDLNGFLAAWKNLNDTLPGGYESIALVSPTRQAAAAVDYMMDYLTTGNLPETEEGGYIYDRMDPITVDQVDDYYRPDLLDNFYVAGQNMSEETLQEKFAK